MNTTLPVDVLHFVPGEFGFKSAVSQSNDPETLLGVALQNLGKVFWHCKETARHFKKFVNLER